MPRANYGFRGDALSLAAAIAAGAKVTAQDYLYNVGLSVITPLTPPGAVTGLSATSGSGQVSLSWTAPSSGTSAITSYDVEITPSGGSPAITNTGSTSASYVVTGLTNGTAYSFRVRANNGTAGDGDYSSSASSTPSGTANFTNPTAGWTSIFGATTSTSGGATTPYAGSVSGLDMDATIAVTPARSGTLRVTGVVNSDDVFALSSGGTTLASVGDYNGTFNATINFSVGIDPGAAIYFSVSNATISSLQVWLV